MLLAIDIGNTNTVFALLEGQSGAIRHVWRMVTQSAKTADEYGAFYCTQMAHHKIGDTVSNVIISSVVPEANFHISRFCETYIAQKPLFVTKDNCGIAVHIDRPEDVGADRLVNAAAILAAYPDKAPAIVIDFGTATTFDIIGANGAYEGGIIAPGINLSITALAQAASKLPKISVTKPARVIGKNTVEAMQSGVYWGYVGLIEGILTRLQNEYPAPSKFSIFATGGLAALFKHDLPQINIIDPELTLKGLYAIFQNQ
ncbi:MAG: type III pantothenate kinase [Alphaproteobacteria bacterium]